MAIPYHRRWVALFIYLSALVLVLHLTDRFLQPTSVSGTTVSCKCPREGWQRLVPDALHWTAPTRKVVSLAQLAVASFVERVPLPPILLGESLFSRPPPSC